MSFSHLASTPGVFEYNNYTFDGSAEVTCRVDFIKDEAARTIIYQQTTIFVRFFVNGGSGCDDELKSIRALLGTAGQPLTFVGWGFGNDLLVNQPGGGGLRDVKWGPMPSELEANPVGSDKTWECRWSVVVCVPVCTSLAAHVSTGVMAMNFGVTFGIDKQGMTTRTISGYMEIAQTRITGGAAVAALGNVPDTVDAYRHLVQPPAIPGYTRETSWSIDYSKSRVDFTITDTQIPSRNPWPAGVTNITGDHRSSYRRGKRQTLRRFHSIDVDIELAPGVSTLLAYRIFDQIVTSRMAAARREAKYLMLDSLDEKEELFGYGMSFSIGYRATLDLPKLFTIINYPALSTNADWPRWLASLTHVYDNRGISGLRLIPGNDAIVDLCVVAPPLLVNAGLKAPPSQPGSAGFFQFKNQQPPPQHSYLDYRVQLRSDSQNPTTRQPIVQQPQQQQGATNPYGTGGANVGSPSQTDDVIQQGGASRHSVSLVGYAMRAGYEIMRPSLVSVGSQSPTEVAAQFMCESLGNRFGIPIFAAAWKIDYLLKNAPGLIHPPQNLEN